LLYLDNFTTTPKVKYRPVGENSPNLVTLLMTYLDGGAVARTTPVHFSHEGSQQKSQGSVL
jgi:hypothetical protein